MTMHLARGLTTVNTKKPKKKKLTPERMKKYQKSLKDHNKHMRRIGAHDLQMDLEQYIAYCHGEHKPRRKAAPVADWYHEGGTVWERPTIDAPSLNSDKSFAPCVKKESIQYTGERRLVGIATMHKSNMVPVFADEDDRTGSKQATEIAKMRRG